jgi:transposase
MPDSTIEIISGREGRRRWGVEEKLSIVAETHEPGATVGSVAARHDVYPSLLRTWRCQVRTGRLSTPVPAHFVPVRLSEPVPTPARRPSLLKTIARAIQSRSSCPMAAACASAAAST